MRRLMAMPWLATIVIIWRVQYSTCMDQYDDDTDWDQGLYFKPFPGSILSFPVNTTDIQKQTTQVSKKMDCVIACTGVPWCRSVNYQTSAQKNGLHVCELISTDKHAHPQNMTQNSTVIHFTIKNPCEPGLCLNGGTCIYAKNNRQIYDCQCTQAYQGDRCQSDANECTDGTHNCHSLANCTNTIGSFTCQCTTGYQGNGVSCYDINECSTGSHNCHPTGANCINNPGSFTCQCRPGYQGDGLNCTDIDECATGSHKCHSSLANCTNTVGSFLCQCHPGYQGNGRACYSPDYCEFEMNMCYWTPYPQETFMWYRISGSTSSSSTGPSGDVTKPLNGAGYYVYAETSSPVQTNQKTELRSPTFNATSGRCLEFAYHMYGSSMGSLNVYVTNATAAARNRIFTKTGNQGQQWYRAHENITSSDDYKVVFEVVRGTSYYSDVALDDIFIKDGSCTAT